MKRFIRPFLICLSALMLAGCSAYIETPKSAEEVLKEDPGFAPALEKKKALDEKISAAGEEFKKEKDSLVEKIKALEGELHRKKQASNEAVAAIKRELDPERNTVKDETKKVKVIIADRQNTLKNIDRMIMDVTRLINKSPGDPKMAGQERAKWEDRIRVLNEEKESLNRDISDAQDRLKLLNSEMRLLRQ